MIKIPRVAVAVLLILGAVVALQVSPASAATTRTLEGTVACQKGKRVVGVWIESSAGGSTWATIKARNGAVWLADYRATITTASRTTKVQLRVGCGYKPGTRTWWSTNTTVFTEISGSTDRSALCTEAAGTGKRCTWWGNTVLIGMPFGGRWACASREAAQSCLRGGQHPKNHHGMGDWTIDVYNDDENVRAIVWGRKGDRVDLTVRENGPTCAQAGSNLRVDVELNGTPLGWVGWGHLDAIPAEFSMGATVPFGAVIGKTRLWHSPQYQPNEEPCWLVDTTGGVHTHMSFDSIATTACYVNYPLGATLGYRRLLGRIGAGGPATRTNCS